MLHNVSRSFSLVIQQLGTDLRDAVCILYLVLQALDIVKDDTSITIDVKVPLLIAFHRHIYDRDWHFSCGTKEYKVLMDQFHHVSTAFLELDVKESMHARHSFTSNIKLHFTLSEAAATESPSDNGHGDGRSERFHGYMGSLPTSQTSKPRDQATIHHFFYPGRKANRGPQQ